MNHSPLALSRRGFLRTAALASLAPAAARAVPAEGFIDAHVHIWTPDTKAYPLAPNFSKKEMVPPSFTPEELFAFTRPAGVTRVVLIQMSFYEFDNRYMLEAIKRYPEVFSGVAIVDENAPGLREKMAALRQEGVRGYRLYTWRDKAEAWAGSANMQAMWKHGAELGQAMCLLANPDALPAVEKMCAAHPETTVVIDHFARVGMKGNVDPAELDALCRLAKFPRVHVKTSAFYALGAKKPPYTDLGPMIRRLRDTFGAQRLMWASDCPYQVQEGHSYSASIGLIREGLDFLSADDRQAMLRGTAEKVFFT